MVAKNDITGEFYKNLKVSSKQYRDNWDMILIINKNGE